MKSLRRSGEHPGGNFYAKNQLLNQLPKDFLKSSNNNILYQEIVQMSKDINRLYNELNRQTRKSKYVNDANRKSRTRTLIQLGGLLDKAGITDKFSIMLGEDLQSDIPQMDKTAVLFGFLIEATATLNDSKEVRLKWQRLGTRAFKYNSQITEQ